MSSEKLTEIVNILPVNILNCPQMSPARKEDLADYVRRTRLEKSLTTQQVAERSGGGITRGYVTQIENRDVTNPSPKKLRALARGLGVPEKIMFELARGERIEEGEEYKDSRFADMSLKFSRLKGQEKKQAELLIDLIDRELERLGRSSQ